MAVATTTALVAASVAATAYSTSQQMGAANDAAKQSKAQARVSAENSAYQGYMKKEMNAIDSEAIGEQVDAEVNKIRSAAQMVRGTQTAQMAASGVVLGDGSAQAAIDHTSKLAEQDALAAMFSGINKQMALQTAGRFAVQDANNVANATVADGNARAAQYQNQANTALLSGISSVAGTLAKSNVLPTSIGGGSSGRAA